MSSGRNRSDAQVLVSLLDAYCGWSKMPRVPEKEEFETELQRRTDRTDPVDEKRALESMFADLDKAQKTIDNRADAVLKLTTFLGAGLTALGNLDSRPAVRILSLIVVCASGCGLGLALQASSHSPHRKTLLMPQDEGDLQHSCHEFKQKQRLLAGATLFTLTALAVALAAVVISLA